MKYDQTYSISYMGVEKSEGVLFVLYFTVFLNSTGLGTSNFLLSVYAETLGATYVDLGKIGAVGNVAYLVVTLVTGYLLDRYERVKMYLVFTFFGAISVSLFAFTCTVNQVMIVRGLLGAFSATFWVTASTLTADLASAGGLTRAMGRYNLSWVLGFTIGPVAGGFIINSLGFRVFFFCLGGLMVLSFLVSAVKLGGRVILRISGGRESSAYVSLRRLFYAYLTLVPFTVVLGIYMAIMPGHMKVVGLTSASIGALIAMTNGVRGLSFFNVERFVYWGPRRSLFLASLLISSSMFLVRGASDIIGFGIPLLLYGVGAGIMTPVVLDFITKRVSRGVLGAAMGVHEGVYGIGMCLGPLVGGGLADVYGASALYLLLVFVALMVLPLSWKMTEET